MYIDGIITLIKVIITYFNFHKISGNTISELKKFFFVWQENQYKKKRISVFLKFSELL